MKIEQHSWDLDELVQEEIPAAGQDSGAFGSVFDAGLLQGLKRVFAALARTGRDICIRSIRCCFENPDMPFFLALGLGMGTVIFFTQGNLWPRLGRYVLKMAHGLYAMGCSFFR
jgi:hypothetical protein